MLSKFLRNSALALAFTTVLCSAADSALAGTVRGNFGSATLTCWFEEGDPDDTTDGYLFMDIQLNSSKGAITYWSGNIDSDSFLEPQLVGGWVNPPNTVAFDQAQISESLLPSGTITAVASGTGTTFQGVFAIGLPSCEVYIP